MDAVDSSGNTRPILFADRLVVSVADLLRFVPVSKPTAYRLAHRLGVVRVGRRVFVPRRAVEQWLAQAEKADLHAATNPSPWGTP